MSYRRVIPRDLFNEADLLKCLGRLWIALTDEIHAHSAVLDYTNGAEGDPFEIEQDPESGAISVTNISLTINGTAWKLLRPLNSRHNWPLWCVSNDDENETPVFSETGVISPEFLELITK